jgi:lysophospholipase L1-like esterase
VIAADWPPAPSAEVRILALGDSYTIGEGVRPDERWPVRLAAALRARGSSTARIAEPMIIARTGWTTDELSRGIDEAAPRGGFDIVTLLVGVNDQYRGRSSRDYRERFRALLQRAVGFAGRRAASVVVISIPDWGVTPFAAGRDRARIASEIDAFNAINKAEAQSAGARYVDITGISRRAATDRSLLASDGLHPSASMYDDWVRVLVPVVDAALAQRRG